ncbi:MAG TPA: MBL fold metallo-hydrolase [Galbitalea sp.]|nr:MBL fold metallo-hydrolase [Galbitalea sp.]
MLNQVADGVQIHVSEWCESSSVVVDGGAGALLVDPGILGNEMTCLAKDLADSGRTVVAGFSTHPHWDHMLWHASFGAPPRYATALAATTARDRLAGGIDARRFGIPEDTPLDLLGDITGLPAIATEIPWDGLVALIIEHRAHTPGHAALFIPDRGVLIAGDMLSDVFIPMLDLRDAADPIGDYLAALALFEAFAEDVDVVVPGHGSVARSGELRERIDQDRAYVLALRDGRDSGDPRIGPSPKPGWEWVRDVHERQVQALNIESKEKRI